jgi:hypothetical protein
MTNLELIKSAPYAVFPLGAFTREPILSAMPVLFNTTLEATQWLHINKKIYANDYVILATNQLEKL